MEIMAVDYGNFDVFFGEELTDFNSTEPTAHDYYMGFRHFKKPPETYSENFNLTG